MLDEAECIENSLEEVVGDGEWPRKEVTCMVRVQRVFKVMDVPAKCVQQGPNWGMACWGQGLVGSGPSSLRSWMCLPVQHRSKACSVVL